MKKENVLTKKFYRDNPVEDLSVANIFYMHHLMYTNRELSDAITNMILPGLEEERTEAIEREEEIINETSSVEELLKLMRKNMEFTSRELIYRKALQTQEEFMPRALELYQKNRQECFIQVCACIFAGADIQYAKRLYDVYNNIKSPYAQALACVVFGIKDMRETTQLLLDEYYRLKKDYPDESYSQCPLYSLHMFR